MDEGKLQKCMKLPLMDHATASLENVRQWVLSKLKKQGTPSFAHVLRLARGKNYAWWLRSGIRERIAVHAAMTTLHVFSGYDRPHLPGYDIFRQLLVLSDRIFFKRGSWKLFYWVSLRRKAPAYCVRLIWGGDIEPFGLHNCKRACVLLCSYLVCFRGSLWIFSCGIC